MHHPSQAIRDLAALHGVTVLCEAPPAPHRALYIRQGATVLLVLHPQLSEAQAMRALRQAIARLPIRPTLPQPAIPTKNH